MDETYRPVQLRKVVLGYPKNNYRGALFKFDINLNYKLVNVIQTYSEDKPTLIVSLNYKHKSLYIMHSNFTT